MNEFDTEIIRFDNPKPNVRLLSEMHVEKGSIEDWNLLSHLHYKLSTLPVGANYWRLRFRDETIGVCVMGMSRPLLKERHAIFPILCPGNDSQVSNIQRYRYINDNFRTCGRFVVDTMYRSNGCAYRFLNLACRLHGFKYLELMSSMSRYNSFAQRAGFQMSKPIRSPRYEKGMKFMRHWFSSHPADIEAIMEEFNGFNSDLQRKVKKELRDFYYDFSSLEKTGSRRHKAENVIDNWPVRRLIIKLQGLFFSSPLYGFYRNGGIIGDKGNGETTRLNVRQTNDMPIEIVSLPLLAFDLQSPTEVLDLRRLEEIKNVSKTKYPYQS